MQELTVQELKSLIDTKKDFQLIDIRETYEVETSTMGGLHIPMGEIIENLDKIARDKPVIIHCKAGGRSANMVNLLSSQFGFNNLYNLKGGILSWSDEIDPSVPKY
ncbi:MAG: rhodanese-like domain-containing protein [Bacteroidetes bacterium]|nr:rhodanese-like domain-containing protein [Bacteroidota bacterium]HET6244068.1 rhodanese-like domain-containing protein [Bacteroidia bacterium]